MRRMRRLRKLLLAADVLRCCCRLGRGCGRSWLVLAGARSVEVHLGRQTVRAPNRRPPPRLGRPYAGRWYQAEKIAPHAEIGQKREEEEEQREEEEVKSNANTVGRNGSVRLGCILVVGGLGLCGDWKDLDKREGGRDLCLE